MAINWDQKYQNITSYCTACEGSKAFAPTIQRGRIKCLSCGRTKRVRVSRRVAARVWGLE